nr:hypothetical protein [Microbacterium testaceum]
MHAKVACTEPARREQGDRGIRSRGGPAGEVSRRIPSIGGGDLDIVEGICDHPTHERENP